MAYLFDYGNPDLQNINEQMGDIIKIGKISSIDPNTNTARVTFPDRDDLVSYDLQVLQRNTGQNKDISFPDVKEDVLCLFLGTGTEDGFILGSVYNDKNPPPVTDPDVRGVEFSDGTKVSYNRKSNELQIVGKGLVNVETEGEVKVIAAKTVTIESAQKAELKGATQVDITAPTINLNAASINFNATGECNSVSQGPFRIKAPRIELN